MIACLLMASHEAKSWEWGGEKFQVQPGQFVTSLESIRKKAGKGISIQNVRSFLKRFEKLEFLTNQTTKHGRLITIINWGSYQEKQFLPTKRATNDQQSSNKAVTPINNVTTKQINIYSRVIDYLNRKTNSSYKSTTKKTQSLIKARSNEGFTPEDFKKVIDYCCSQWMTDEKMVMYLRPDTLFSSKFEGYLNAAKRVNGSIPQSHADILKEHGFDITA